MARPPKGKPLTLRPIRLDDDVWAECQRLGKIHGTINEGLRAKLLPRLVRVDISELSGVPSYCPVCGQKDGYHHPVCRLGSPEQGGKRGPRSPRLNKREKAAQELAASDLTAQVVAKQR